MSTKGAFLMTVKASNDIAWKCWQSKRAEFANTVGISPQDLALLDEYFAPGGEVSKLAKTHQIKAVDAVVNFGAFVAKKLLSPST
jgi:hypothetical protein